MKRATRFRVRKRDGRTEWLRATKLARSIGLAIAAARGEEFDIASSGLTGEDWRTADLTAAILTGLQEHYGCGRMLSTSAIADAVQQVLLATGFPCAAEEYARAAGEQQRRRADLQRYLPPSPAEMSDAAIAGVPWVPRTFSVGETGPAQTAVRSTAGGCSLWLFPLTSV